MTASVAPLVEHLERQFGLVTFPQAIEVLSRRQVEGLIRQSVLVRVGRGVYRLTGVEPSFRQRALAACLTVGSPVAVSHMAAARIWEVPGGATSTIEITVPPHRHPRAAPAVVHRRPLAVADVTERHRIPVVRPARLLLDLSWVLSPPALSEMADELARAGHLSVSELRSYLARGDGTPAHRRDHIAALLAQDATRGGARPGLSPAEDWVFDAIVGAGLPPPVRNCRVRVAGRTFELDLAYPGLQIGIEYDGWAVHGDRTHFHRDRDRLALFQLAGWLILQVTSRWTADLVVARLAQAIALRKAAGGDWPQPPAGGDACC